ncbi:Crp/Fnr family transcriptional regulator [Myxococcus sp. AM009]|uniref:Crp/Fnr family transcriptional regulator n=1 Tax=unclassified Myxococcus TaxID=2648731 RepID=UPI00159515B2|nr:MULTISPECIES: Crp/Fnr family transcriptional regulator [unclassified Myxococcus]NVJ01763.1 Crp/Fnr family transcriptional regulator [Myxococcus sp. AM009]NVJ13467.1 Crp/Fnr family transcriptional regulator [Myxococcus sp. AM010]
MRYPKLFEHIAALAPLPASEWLKAEALAREQALDKRALFLRPGDSADRFGLVLQGVFRAVRVSARGEESIKAFRAEGELIGAYAEMLQGQPSMTSIEALEPGRVLAFQARDLQALEAGHACWAQLARRVAEQHYILKERREQEFLDLSAEERLERFWQEHPHLHGRVPQRDVAAYLGITEVALSRIVSRRRKRAE